VPRLKLTDGLGQRHRLVALLMLVALLHGLAYAFLVPPWQAPDEPGHYEYARLLAEVRRPLRRADRSSALEREIIASLSAHDFWHWVGAPVPQPLPASFAEDPFLVRSGHQVGDEPYLHYLVPALICRLVSGIEIQVRFIRLYSLLLTVLAVGVIALTAWELFPNDRWLAAAVASFQALLPMVAFIGNTVNNDALALLSSNLFFWALIRTCRRGLNGKRAAILMLLTLLALGSKKTTAFLFPLMLVALLYLARQRGGLRPGHGAVASLLLIVAAVGLILWLGRGPAPTGWMWRKALVASGRTDQAAHQGRFALQVGEEGPPWLVQAIPAQAVQPWLGEVITFTASVRSKTGLQWGRLTLHDGEEVQRGHFLVGPRWTQQQLAHRLLAQPDGLRIAIAAGLYGDEESAKQLYFDDLRLIAPDGTDLLRNGGAEAGARWIEEAPAWLMQQALLWAKLIQPERPPMAAMTSVLSRLLGAQSYDVASLQRYGLYMLLTFAGFWANFGWLTLPLPVGIYAFLALVCAAAAAGLVWQAVWVIRGEAVIPGWQRGALRLLGLGVILVLAQTFLPMIGRNWQPQGRYLFPAFVPIATTLCLGLRAWVRPPLRPVLWIAYWAGFFVLDMYCLLGRVGGYYYW